MSIDNKSLVIFANQLLPLPVLVEALPEGGKGFDVFMAEDVMFCRHYQYHQQKLVLMLAAMRHYADELRSAGFTVHYHQLDPASVSFQDQLHSWLQRLAVTELWHFEIETKPLQSRLRSLCAALNVTRNEIPSPMFLCNRQEFESFVDDSKSLQMARFYKQQRLKLDILLTPDCQPQGGQWSFDAENRKKLPKDVQPPALPQAFENKHLAEVISLVAEVFVDHPGQAKDFCWPTTRAGA